MFRRIIQRVRKWRFTAPQDTDIIVYGIALLVVILISIYYMVLWLAEWLWGLITH